MQIAFGRVRRKTEPTGLGTEMVRLETTPTGSGGVQKRLFLLMTDRHLTISTGSTPS